MVVSWGWLCSGSILLYKKEFENEVRVKMGIKAIFIYLRKNANLPKELHSTGFRMITLYELEA